MSLLTCHMVASVWKQVFLSTPSAPCVTISCNRTNPTSYFIIAAYFQNVSILPTYLFGNCVHLFFLFFKTEMKAFWYCFHYLIIRPYGIQHNVSMVKSQLWLSRQTKPYCLGCITLTTDGYRFINYSEICYRNRSSLWDNLLWSTVAFRYADWPRRLAFLFYPQRMLKVSNRSVSNWLWWWIPPLA